MEELLHNHPEWEADIAPDALKFYRSLTKRTGGKVELDRTLAGRIAGDLIEDFRNHARELLLRLEGPYTAPPIDGLHAMAEIALDIKAALVRKRGRQPRIDPVEAYEENAKAKKSRQRSARGIIGDPYAHETTAEALHVSNKGSVAEAVKLGKEIVGEFQDKALSLPPGTEVLTHLVDIDGPAGERVKASIVATKGRPPFTGENST
jgi:hypothetical protein